jgi:adenylate kinase family enzyme
VDTIYLIGQPGSGKTTLTKELQKTWAKVNMSDKPFKHQEWEAPNLGKVYSLGWDREHFSGTDTLGNTVITQMPAFYEQAAKEVDYIYGEGDRLASAGFMDIANLYGTLHLFYLATDNETAQARRTERSAKTGKTQNPSWVKGRVTKHENLAKKFNAYYLPGDKTPSQITQIMADYLYRGKGNT